MTLTIDEVRDVLAETELASSDQIDSLLEELPEAVRAADSKSLVKCLVERELLTAYQGQVILRGKGRSLRLGSYLIQNKLGEGGMGMVFRARHVTMKREVALKVISGKVAKNSEMMLRFQREVEATGKLNHPNIVVAHDASEDNATAYLVMEYIEGKDLSAIVKKKGPLTISQAINMIRQAALGLEYAHSQGVIHRDIKPSNLLLDHEGTLKILDMGLARFDEDGASELTASGAVMGTIDYMAPEQALNTKHANAQSDIYSLGCTLWYLLLGKPIFGGESIFAKVLAHRSQPTPSLLEERKDIPDELQAIFDKMVAKKPENRYASMSELIADLEKFKSGDSELTAMKSIYSYEDDQLEEFLSEAGATAVNQDDGSSATPRSPQISSGMETDEEFQSLRRPRIVGSKTPVRRKKQSAWWQDWRTLAILGASISLILIIVMFAGGSGDSKSNNTPEAATLPTALARNSNSGQEPTNDAIAGGSGDSKSNNTSEAAASSTALAQNSTSGQEPTNDAIAGGSGDSKSSNTSKAAPLSTASSQNSTSGQEPTNNANAQNASTAGKQTEAPRPKDSFLSQIGAKQKLKFGQTVDLTQMFDPSRHTKEGSWKVEDGVIVSGTARYSSLVLPYSLPENYVMYLRLKVLRGKTGITVRGRLQESFFQLILNGWDNTASGLQLLDDLEPKDPKNESYHAGRVIGSEKRSDVYILCHHGNSVQVTVDGKTIIDWQGDPSRLRLRDRVAPEEHGKVYLSTVLTSWEISKFEITPILDDPKQEVPDKSAIAEAERTLKQKLDISFRVTGRNAKLKFAQQLRTFLTTETEPVRRYVIYRHAVENAAEAGNLDLSFELAKQLADEFDVPLRELQTESIISVARQAGGDVVADYQLAVRSAEVAWDAIEHHQYQEADDILNVGLNLAKKSRVGPLIDQLDHLESSFEKWKTAYVDVKESHEAIVGENASPSDHLAWGKFLCFVREDWKAGLIHLKQSGNGELAKLAEAELSPPTAFEPVMKLVQNWLTQAKKFSGAEREAIESHARRLAATAMPFADENEIPLVFQHATKLFDGAAIIDTRKSPEGILIGGQNANLPQQGTVEFWIRTTDRRGALFIKREEEPHDTISIITKQGPLAIYANSEAYGREGYSEASISDGRWHHIALGKIDNDFRLYVDGQPVIELTPRDGFPRPNNSPWRLGNHIWLRDFNVEAQYARFRVSSVNRYYTRFVPQTDYKADRATLLILE